MYKKVGSTATNLAMLSEPPAHSAPEEAEELGLTARIRIAHPDVQWERLQYILDLSFDYYWELDSELRIVQVWHSDSSERRRVRDLLLGQYRWGVGGSAEKDSWEDHRATLEAHEEFKDFLTCHPCAIRGRKYLRCAGRPRFDEKGRFVGYMGITQDVTREVLRSRLEALELTVTKHLIHSEISPDLLARVLSAFRDCFGWRYGRYWKPTTDGERLFLASSTRKEELQQVLQAQGTAHLLASRDGRVGRVWNTLRQAPSSDGMVGPDAIHDAGSRVLIPLSHLEDCFGVLEFGLPDDTGLRTELTKPLLRIANHIGIALAKTHALRLLRQSEERFASTVELAAIGICHVGLDGTLLHVNAQMAEMLGYERDELTGKNVREISHADDEDATEGLRQQLHTGEIASFRVEKRYLRRDGQSVWVRINTVVKWGDDGKPLHYISIVEDVSESKQAEAKIEHLATHDSLTGLPNRNVMSDLLAARIAAKRVGDTSPFAVLFIDMDRFKAINDSLGHHTGDSVLKSVAGRIRKAIRASDQVARFGGDEFVVLLGELKDAAQARTVAEEILRTFHAPIIVGNQEFRVGASIGLAVYPEDGSEPEALLRNADLAMYSAKEEGRNTVRRFDSSMGTTSVREIALEVHLAHGLEREEFLLQYQPRVDAHTGELVSAEALMRWWNRELGTVPPIQFIPVAEETGIIIPLGRWAIERACEEAMRWEARTNQPIAVSVNLSPKQFRDADLLRYIADALSESGLPSDRLELEITESAIMVNIEESVAIAKSIRDMGVRLALDDFGTGYSSLAQLRRLPLDALKIDRSFVRDIVTSEEDQTITAAIVAMAKKLQISVVAEGVETAEQSVILTNLGCDELQGYYFGEPNHPDEIIRMLRPRALAR